MIAGISHTKGRCEVDVMDKFMALQGIPCCIPEQQSGWKTAETIPKDHKVVPQFLRQVGIYTNGVE